MRSSDILNIENDDKYCFICSILATLHPCGDSHPNTVSNYRPYLTELNVQSFDFGNGCKCSSSSKSVSWSGAGGGSSM